MKQLIVISLVLVLSVFASCEKGEVQQVNLGYSYFPTTIGSYKIYDVDSIVHDGFTRTVTTYQYQIKEKITESFLDLEGRSSFRIERQYRDTVTDAWSGKVVSYATPVNNKLETVENNLRVIKLIFPVTDGQSWDGNGANGENEKLYNYDGVHVSTTINNVAMDSVLTVAQFENVNAIEEYYQEEKYAAGIGLVSRTDVGLDYQSASGLAYYLKINSYGVE